MKSIYSTPNVTTLGDIVRYTLINKTLGSNEFQSRKVPAGSNLSFGL